MPREFAITCTNCQGQKKGCDLFKDPGMKNPPCGRCIHRGIEHTCEIPQKVKKWTNETSDTMKEKFTSSSKTSGPRRPRRVNNMPHTGDVQVHGNGQHAFKTMPYGANTQDGGATFEQTNQQMVAFVYPTGVTNLNSMQVHSAISSAPHNHSYEQHALNTVPYGVNVSGTGAFLEQPNRHQQLSAASVTPTSFSLTAGHAQHESEPTSFCLENQFLLTVVAKSHIHHLRIMPGTHCNGDLVIVDHPGVPPSTRLRDWLYSLQISANSLYLEVEAPWVEIVKSYLPMYNVWMRGFGTI